MKLVAQLRGRFGVEPILRVLGIASSTYYGWVQRQANPSQHQRDDEELVAKIVDIHTISGGTYGSPRVYATLRRRGIRVSRKRVERLMRGHELQGAFLRKKWRTPSTRRDPRAVPAPDLVNRDFTAPAPDRLWVADATRIPTGEGVLAGRGPRRLLQPDRGLEDQRPLRHQPRARRAGVRHLVPRGPRRAADPPQRPRLDLHLSRASSTRFSVTASIPQFRDIPPGANRCQLPALLVLPHDRNSGRRHLYG